ncbi:hypothetical protein [Citreimonas sp.]|uniref:hypothetical protein n=1 Tax=Citreimonas sp. TaxID=3036715 RepID=UPI004057FDDE
MPDTHTSGRPATPPCEKHDACGRTPSAGQMLDRALRDRSMIDMEVREQDRDRARTIESRFRWMAASQIAQAAALIILLAEVYL